MSDFWTAIEGLEDTTAYTLDLNKPFEVIKVTGYACVIAVPSQDKARPKVRVLYREDLSPLHDQLVRDRELSIEAIKRVFKFNSSYASALLAAGDGVVVSTRPIHLTMAA